MLLNLLCFFSETISVRLLREIDVSGPSTFYVTHARALRDQTLCIRLMFRPEVRTNLDISLKINTAELIAVK